MKELNELIIKEETGMNRELFQRHFNFQMPSSMLKTLLRINDKKKNDDLVKLVKSRLKELKEEIEKMSENEVEIEETYKMENMEDGRV